MSHAHRPEPPPGYSRSLPAHLPEPTPIPALFAFGVALFGWGLISSRLLVLIGATVVLVTLLEWVREISHGAK